MSDVEWPEPQLDPVEEPGENRYSHLLPPLSRLHRMPDDEREALFDLVREWEGPLVERFRAAVIRQRDL